MYGLSVAHANDVMDPERFVATSAGLLFVNGIGTSLGPVASAVLVDSIGPSGLFLFFGVVLGGFAVFAAVTCALRRLRPATRGGLVASP